VNAHVRNDACGMQHYSRGDGNAPYDVRDDRQAATRSQLVALGIHKSHSLLFVFTARRYVIGLCYVSLSLPVAGLYGCSSTNSCATLCTVSTDTARRAVRRRQRSFL